MKKVVFLAAAVLFFSAVNAQIPVTGKKTVTTADTIALDNIGSKVVSYQATYLETSGASAGKFYLEGTVDGRAWVHIDSSKSVTDVTTYQTVIVTATATPYRAVRARFSNTSSATGTFWFTALRRPDDR